MSQKMAHNIEGKQRTEDIQIDENVDFTAMLLSDNVLKGLQSNGFRKPSPIQLKAIPLGRCGFDLIMKAKSGTGKTAVFGIVALEMVNVEKNCVQVLILAPTREIAVQIQQVILSIGADIKGLRVEYFIGGTIFQDDITKLKHCHIAVGAPGRVQHLIEKGHMNVSETRLFILDEADKLMQDSYQLDVNRIYHKLPIRKQMIASSATYPETLDLFLAKYMSSPTHVSPDANVPVLLGLKQFYTIVQPHLNVLQQIKLKIRELLRILSTISFNQCLIFSNYQTRAESLSNNLNHKGWPSLFISGSQNQATRLKAVASLKEFKCRILSSTDLTARGIDAANVDLVINFDVPIDTETYLHRMGRAGRYGSYGICITITAEGEDVVNLQKILGNIGNNMSIAKYPSSDQELPADIWNCNTKEFEQLDGIVSQPEESLKEKSDVNLQTIKNTDSFTEENLISEVCQHIENNDKNQEEKSVGKEEFILTAVKQLTNLLSKPYSTSAEANHAEIVNCVKNLLKKFSAETDLTIQESILKYENIDNKTLINKFAVKSLEMETKFSPTDLTAMDIGSMLDKINKENELNAEKIAKKYDNLDCESIVNKLTMEVDPQYIEEPEVNESKNKRKKLNQPIKEILHSDKNITNSQFENEAKSFQENMILTKNIALYSITKFLLDQKEVLSEECIKSIDILLEIIKNEENVEKTHVKLNILEDLKESFKESVPEDKSDDISIINEKDVQFCECAENVFITAFDFASTEESPHWIASLCPIHNYIDPEKDVETSGEEFSEDINETYMEEGYEEEFMEENAEIEENLFEYAYNYAVQGSSANVAENYETVREEPTNEIFGYAVNNSYYNKPVKTGKTLSKKSVLGTSTNINPLDENITNFITRRNCYESYYQHYSDVLATNAPLYTNVEDFDKFFSKWQQELGAVRDYVQQDIYDKEMFTFRQ